MILFSNIGEMVISQERYSMILDYENKGVPKHLGMIADFMYEWEGRIADELELTPVDVCDIKQKYPSQLNLQTYVQT